MTSIVDLGALDAQLSEAEIQDFRERAKDGSVQPAGSAEQRLRLSLFAALNGFEFGAHRGAVNYPGMIFGLGYNRGVSQHILRRGENFLDIGNYGYTVNDGKTEFSYGYGFVAIKLQRRMPHLVLDSNKNNFLGATQLPVGFSSKQRISLEGNFDEYFTMYCPKGYERDALYVFTPDLMALMIDEAVSVDAEIIDDWMFLYQFGGFDLSNPQTMATLFGIIETVGAKTLARTVHYADSRHNLGGEAVSGSVGAGVSDRMAHNQVSAAGARLKRGMAPPLKIAVWVTSIVIGIPVVWGIAQIAIMIAATVRSFTG
ncbi:hypothetical protein [Salinibacterium sp. SWN248]|uniref:hypothetical protein n=1 Tax=Salinibacterium sp. SWN248 TaxID=2792056 RepID=UPI0018CDD27B|nr:hypothetical protein [Salinibacterium sp. SWN248]MBH0024539.1 hypothetical protein [Salinibacterium sp. SWN248]